MSFSPSQITAVVLAGGLGQRIRHLVPDLPKPMAPVADRPFLEWVVRYLAAQGIQNIILSTGYLAETVEKYFRSQPVKNTCIECVVETTPLGTAGGFLNAVRHEERKPAAWLVLNGDSLVLAPLEAIFRSLEEPEVYGALLAIPMAEVSRFGTISQDPRGELVGFNEKKPGAGIISAGVYLFRVSAIDFFPDKMPLSFETDVFPALIAQGIRLKVCVTDAPFLDIGTPESLPLAEKFIRQHSNSFYL